MIANEFVLKVNQYVWLDHEKQYNLKNKRKKLFYFWSASCLACDDVASKIRNFMNENQDDFNLVMIHIPLQENDLQEDTIIHKLARYHLNAPVILDHKTELIQQLNVQCVPTMILLNEENINVSQHIHQSE